MFLISSPPAVMEGSSVYMCFPCYQEFNTLEEVLKHQLTCTAEDDQSAPSGTIPVTVPVLQTQVSTGTRNTLCGVFSGKRKKYSDSVPWHYKPGDWRNRKPTLPSRQSSIQNNTVWKGTYLVMNWLQFWLNIPE